MVNRATFTLLSVLVLAACGPKLPDGRACPWRAARAGAAPPAGTEQWCERKGPNDEGIRHGPYARWYPNGAPWVTGEYHGNEKTGAWTFWHENGKRARQEYYRDGAFDGVILSWYPSGQKRSQRVFFDGKRAGIWKKWSLEGQLIASLEFRDDREWRGHWIAWQDEDEGEAVVSDGRYCDGERCGLWKEKLRFTDPGFLCSEWEQGRQVRAWPCEG